MNGECILIRVPSKESREKLTRVSLLLILTEMGENISILGGKRRGRDELTILLAKSLKHSGSQLISL